jgi:hypothetical protein
MANLELGVRLTPASVLSAASISKQFTAMSRLLLADRGATTGVERLWHAQRHTLRKSSIFLTASFVWRFVVAPLGRRQPLNQLPDHQMTQ